MKGVSRFLGSSKCPSGHKKTSFKTLVINTCAMCLVAQSCLTLATPWTVTCQVPLSMGFSRQEHWSGLPFSSPGDLPEPRIEPRSPASQADSLQTELRINT